MGHRGVGRKRTRDAGRTAGLEFRYADALSAAGLDRLPGASSDEFADWGRARTRLSRSTRQVGRLRGLRRRRTAGENLSGFRARSGIRLDASHTCRRAPYARWEDARFGSATRLEREWMHFPRQERPSAGGIACRAV